MRKKINRLSKTKTKQNKREWKASNRQDQAEKQISRMENKAETRIYLDICTNKKVNKYDQNFEVWDIFKRPKVKKSTGMKRKLRAMYLGEDDLFYENTSEHVPNLEKEMEA